MIGHHDPQGSQPPPTANRAGSSAPVEPVLSRLVDDLQHLPTIHQATLADAIRARFTPERHGDLGQWLDALDSLPELGAAIAHLDRPAVTLETATPNPTLDVEDSRLEPLRQALQRLHPWRKGPWDYFGVEIDAEWRSDLKFSRLIPALPPLAGREVLDIGCGNGYYALRLAGLKASVWGLDTSVLAVCQALAARRYAPEVRARILPLRFEQWPQAAQGFDLVLSMGVIYHHRNPIGHLHAVRRCLAPGGVTVVESMVIPGGPREVLIPADRYARAANVHFLPSTLALARWLRRAGLTRVEVVDESLTTTDEQRRTPWMRFHSLAQFLDPEDPSRTVEGYPAPRRALLRAEAATEW